MKKEIIKDVDYRNEDRPKTRLGQFGDIFKHRFGELIKLSLLQAIFNMPLIVSLILFYALIRSSGDINSLMTIFIIQGASFLISLPCAFIGMTGTFYCMKKLAYAEGEFAASSFFIGLREEWKKGILIGLLAGISAAIAVIGFFFFYFYLSQFNTTITGLGIATTIIQFIVVLMVSYYALGQVVFYSNQMRFVYKNAFLLTLMRFPLNLLFFIIHPGIFIILSCIMEITMYVGIVIILFFSSFFHLMWVLNEVSAFDKYINKENNPDFYRRGLANMEPNEEA